VSLKIQDKFFPAPNFGDPNTFHTQNYRELKIKQYDPSTYWTTRIDHIHVEADRDNRGLHVMAARFECRARSRLIGARLIGPERKDFFGGDGERMRCTRPLAQSSGIALTMRAPESGEGSIEDWKLLVTMNQQCTAGVIHLVA